MKLSIDAFSSIFSRICFFSAPIFISLFESLIIFFLEIQFCSNFISYTFFFFSAVVEMKYLKVVRSKG